MCSQRILSAVIGFSGGSGNVFLDEIPMMKGINKVTDFDFVIDLSAGVQQLYVGGIGAGAQPSPVNTKITATANCLTC